MTSLTKKFNELVASVPGFQDLEITEPKIDEYDKWENFNVEEEINKSDGKIGQEVY